VVCGRFTGGPIDFGDGRPRTSADGGVDETAFIQGLAADGSVQWVRTSTAPTGAYSSVVATGVSAIADGTALARVLIADGSHVVLGAADTFRAAAEQQDLSGYYKLNLEFHELLMKIASNQTLAELYLSIVKQTHLFRRRGLVQQGSLKTSNEEHRAIVQALAQHDAAVAEQTLARHVAQGWLRLAGTVSAV
jgi:hypothetical protein